MTAIQRGLLQRGVFIASNGSGFLSTVTTESDIDTFGDALAEVMRA